MKRQICRHYSRKMAVLCLLVVAGATMMTGCKKEKINTATTHTTAAAETMAKETQPETMVAVTEEVKETEAVKNVTAKKEVYESGNHRIEYPVVLNVEDATKAEALDQLMKANALAVIDGLGLDEHYDLDVTCQVMSADRNQITIVYKGTFAKEGSKDTTNVFYTSTVDVQKAENVRLSKFADPYTLAGYVLSADCVFPDADDALSEVLMKEKNKLPLDQYAKLFQNADFSADGTYPQVFSYEHEGNIYFSIPVSHDAGDYAIVMFSPDGK